MVHKLGYGRYSAIVSWWKAEVLLECTVKMMSRSIHSDETAINKFRHPDANVYALIPGCSKTNHSKTNIVLDGFLVKRYNRESWKASPRGSMDPMESQVYEVICWNPISTLLG